MMATPFVPINEISNRIHALQSLMARDGVDGAVIMQRADLIYYVGAVFQGLLCIPQSGKPLLAVWRGIERIPEGLPYNVCEIKSMYKLGELLANGDFLQWKKVGIEDDVLPVATFNLLLKKVWAGAQFHSLSLSILIQRAVKSEWEREKLRASGIVLAKGFDAAKGIIREGMPEWEAMALMEMEMRKLGASPLVRIRGFNSEAGLIFASGESAAAPTHFDGPVGQLGMNPLAPVGVSGRLMRKNEPILVDVVCAVDGYITDMTRTFSMGDLDGRFVDAHNFCVHVLESVIGMIKPGVVPADLYDWAIAEAKGAGYSDVFMNSVSSQVRFLGHGTGLELDEFPIIAGRFTNPLQEGMCIALEPKIIFPDGGVGVEDTVLVTSEATEVLTECGRGVLG